MSEIENQANTDEWASALDEQSFGRSAGAATAAAKVFDELAGDATKSGNLNDFTMILDIPVNLTVELGRTRIAIRDLLQLAHGSIIELEGLAGEPMDVLVNGTLIARGEVVVVSEKFGIRITDIITPEERMSRIKR